MLCWSDFCGATTGFGTVSKYILHELHASGKYEIDQLGINFFETFYDKEKYPYNVTPARLDNPNDPYGNQMFLQAAATGKYDIIFIINDTFVVHGVAEKLAELRTELSRRGKKPFKIIYYYPVDCCVLDSYSGMLRLADYPVAYTQFAVDETLKVLPELEGKLHCIYHGTDVINFHKLPDRLRIEARQQLLKCGPETFVVVNVNRNNVRKDIPTCIKAFAEFKKRVPQSRMYLHTKTVDNNIDLRVCIQQLGLNPQTDVISPVNYHTARGFPVNVMNNVYNMADCFITTTLGEGWGLCLESSTILDTSTIPKKIKDIEIGDEVIGQDGRFHEVLAKTHRLSKGIYSVESMYTPDTLVTKEHPFFALRKGESVPEWLNVRELNPGDYVAVVKPKDNIPLSQSIDLLDYVNRSSVEYDEDHIWYKMGYSPKQDGMSISDIQVQYGVSKRVAEDARRVVLGKSLPSRGKPGSVAYETAQKIINSGLEVNEKRVRITRHIPVSDEFLYFIGWYLAEGSNGNKHRVELDLHAKEIPFAERLASFAKEYFGLDPVVEKNGVNKCRLRLASGVLANIMGELCGVHAPNKRIPTFLMKSPQSLEMLLKALFQGDGTIDFNHRTISLTTTSPSLAHQSRHICAANNILLSIRRYFPKLGNYDKYLCGVATPCLPNWMTFTHGVLSDVRTINRKPSQHFLETEDYFFIKVKRLEYIKEFEDIVYDICVKDSHSFVGNGILVHNTAMEAAAAEIPVIVPDNTVHREIFGNNRGMVYPAKTCVWVDNSGYRKRGSVDAVASALYKCYSTKQRKPQKIDIMTQNARQFCEENSWEIVGKQWLKLFENASRPSSQGATPQEDPTRGGLV